MLLKVIKISIFLIFQKIIFYIDIFFIKAAIYEKLIKSSYYY